MWYVWEFISKYGIKIHSTLKISHQRENDRFLMDLVHGNFLSISEISSINSCRQHLEVLTISDIVCGDGIRMRDDILNFKNPVGEDRKYKWAIEKPSAKDKRIWREAIARVTNDLRIYPPLGKWINKGKKTWVWWFSQSTCMVFKKVNNPIYNIEGQ